MKATFIFTVVVFLALLGSCGASSITPIDPFTGSISEDFETLTSTTFSLSVLGGNGLMSGYLSPSSFYSVDGAQSLLVEWAAPASIIFNSPVYSFGGYWAADSTFIPIQFYGTGGLMGEVTIPCLFGSMQWAGWSTSDPITSIGVGVLDHGVWMDGLQASVAVPEPATLLLMGIGIIFISRLKGGHRRSE